MDAVLAFLKAAVEFVLAHQAVFVGLAVALLDFVFAIVPSVASNGLVHWLYLQLKGKAELPPAQ